MSQPFFPSAREYARIWGVDRERLARLPEGAIVMHPGPMNRGVELTADAADAPNSVITEQVTNGIAVRMSCLYLMLGGEGEGGRGAAGGGGGGEGAAGWPASRSRGPGASA